jgi:uncharacterized protein
MRGPIAPSYRAPGEETHVPDLPFEIWGIALAITLLAGFVKGAVGFAMPLIMVSGLTTIMEPAARRGGDHPAGRRLERAPDLPHRARAPRRGGPRRVALCPVGVHRDRRLRAVVPRIDPQVFYLLLGVPVVLISMIQLLGVRLTIPPRHRGWAEWVAGSSRASRRARGTWGPTTVLYLLAIDMPKAGRSWCRG